MKDIENKLRPKLTFAASVERVAAARQGLRFRNRYEIECRDRDGRLKWRDHIDNVVVNAGLNDALDKYFKGSAYTAGFFVGLIGAGAGTVAITAAANAVTGTGTAFAAADVASDIVIAGAGASGADLVTTVAGQTSATALTTTANAGTTVSGANYAIEPRPADTLASKSFNEDASYSNATRPALTLGAVSGQSVDNSASKAAFTINAAARIFGAFVATDSTKSGTAGTLYGGGLFAAGSKLVGNGDTLNVTVTLTAASA